MALELVEARGVSEQPFERHLEPHEVAAYLDRAVTGDRRRRIEAHLAACADCRAEVVEAASIVSSLPAPRTARRRIWLPLTAAAAVLLMLAWPRAGDEPVLPGHREAPVTATVAPRALAPVGTIDSATMLVWSAVPGAYLYQLRLYDGSGSVLWERESVDTTVVIPAATALEPGRLYYWKVEAASGFDRRVSSELVEFSIRQP